MFRNVGSSELFSVPGACVRPVTIETAVVYRTCLEAACGAGRGEAGLRAVSSGAIRSILASPSPACRFADRTSGNLREFALTFWQGGGVQGLSCTVLKRMRPVRPSLA
jgi:hypothetical protein